MRINKCRFCGNSNIEFIGGIGNQCLSSVFPSSPSDNYSKSPLELALCIKDKRTDSCGSVQLAHDYNLQKMYQEYPYSSSSNSSMKGVLENVASSAFSFCDGNSNVILDTGGNDGTLLSFFEDKAEKLINIDPASNVKPIINSSKYHRIVDFFTKEKYFQSFGKQKVNLAFSIAMFYHLSNPIKFAKDIESVLDDSGVWVIQMAYLPAMINTNMYDNIVHEHIGYYGVTHMQWILSKANLDIFNVLENDVYGGSFRLFVKKKNNIKIPIYESVQNYITKEIEEGIYRPETYQSFFMRVNETKNSLISLINSLMKDNKSIWIYGASTKGNSIMQFCNIDNSQITAAADTNSFKIGKYIIGSNIPILSEEQMRSQKPDYLLCLPYGFVEDFILREDELINQGTKFIVPLPEVRILP